MRRYRHAKSLQKCTAYTNWNCSRFAKFECSNLSKLESLCSNLSNLECSKYTQIRVTRNTSGRRVPASTAFYDYVPVPEVLPVSVPATTCTSTRTCFWILRLMEDFYKRNLKLRKDQCTSTRYLGTNYVLYLQVPGRVDLK
eukprot:SAG11_NODE_3419_length_2459_cov_5.175424_2_plen_141_part_00